MALTPDDLVLLKGYVQRKIRQMKREPEELRSAEALLFPVIATVVTLDDSLTLERFEDDEALEGLKARRTTLDEQRPALEDEITRLEDKVDGRR